MNELTRAINAAHTTLYNSINALNALNFNKFVENVRLHTNLSYIGCIRAKRNVSN